MILLARTAELLCDYAAMIRKQLTLLLLCVCLAACLPFLFGPALAQADLEPDEDELEVERTIDLQATLVGVESLPKDGRAIARFRILDGEYAGALFSFSYDYSRPVRLRSWDMHNESGYRRIGGARVTELPLGQWDYLLVPRSRRPVKTIDLTLLQHDLNEDEEQRRWHFKTLVSIVPASRKGRDARADR